MLTKEQEAMLEASLEEISSIDFKKLSQEMNDREARAPEADVVICHSGCAKPD